MCKDCSNHKKLSRSRKKPKSVRKTNQKHLRNSLWDRELNLEKMFTQVLIQDWRKMSIREQRKMLKQKPRIPRTAKLQKQLQDHPGSALPTPHHQDDALQLIPLKNLKTLHPPAAEPSRKRNPTNRTRTKKMFLQNQRCGLDQEVPLNLVELRKPIRLVSTRRIKKTGKDSNPTFANLLIPSSVGTFAKKFWAASKKIKFLFNLEYFCYEENYCSTNTYWQFVEVSVAKKNKWFIWNFKIPAVFNGQ